MTTQGSPIPRCLNRSIKPCIEPSPARPDEFWIATGSSIVSPSRVLQVGFGSGIWIRFWTEFGARQIVGVDLTEVAVERLRMRHPQPTFLQADVGEPGLSVGGVFDFILRDERSAAYR